MGDTSSAAGASSRERLRPIACCGFPELGALRGGPMRPERIHDLMRDLSVPKVAHVIPDTGDDGEPPSSR